jgi:hypothetical protein
MITPGGKLWRGKTDTLSRTEACNMQCFKGKDREIKNFIVNFYSKINP